MDTYFLLNMILLKYTSTLVVLLWIRIEGCTGLTTSLCLQRGSAGTDPVLILNCNKDFVHVQSASVIKTVTNTSTFCNYPQLADGHCRYRTRTLAADLATCNAYSSCRRSLDFVDVSFYCGEEFQYGHTYALVEYQCLPRKLPSGQAIEIVDMGGSNAVESVHPAVYMYSASYPQPTSLPRTTCRVSSKGADDISVRVTFLDFYVQTADPCGYQMVFYNALGSGPPQETRVCAEETANRTLSLQNGDTTAKAEKGVVQMVFDRKLEGALGRVWMNIEVLTGDGGSLSPSPVLLECDKNMALLGETGGTAGSLTTTPTTSTTSATTSQPEDRRKAPSKGMSDESRLWLIVGCAVGGGLLFLILLIVCLVLCCRKRSRSRTTLKAGDVIDAWDTSSTLTNKPIGKTSNPYDTSSSKAPDMCKNIYAEIPHPQRHHQDSVFTTYGQETKIAYSRNNSRENGHTTTLPHQYSRKESEQSLISQQSRQRHGNGASTMPYPSKVKPEVLAKPTKRPLDLGATNPTFQGQEYERPVHSPNYHGSNESITYGYTTSFPGY